MQSWLPGGKPTDAYILAELSGKPFDEGETDDTLEVEDELFNYIFFFVGLFIYLFSYQFIDFVIYVTNMSNKFRSRQGS